MKNKLRHSLAWFVIFLFNLSFLGGCIKKQKETKVDNMPPLVRIPIVKDFPSLDPHDLCSRLTGSNVGKWVFEGLTRLNLEGEYELAGAEKVDISPCEMRYTFTLRKNCYSNGEPVTASDYEYAWKKAISPKSNCAKAFSFYCIKNAENIKNGSTSLENFGVTARDDRTLVVDLEYPAPYFLKLVASSLFAPFKTKGNEVFLNGPYTIDEWQHEDYFTLKVNPFFWDKGRIQVPKVKVCIIEDPNTVFSLYQSGEVDLIGGPFNLISSDILSAEIPKGTFLKEGNHSSLPFWVYLNTESFPLSSPYIRRALGYAVNREEISRHVLVGDDPLFTPFPNTQLSEESVHYDPVKAKQLFEKGLEELGLTKETFPTLKLSSCSYIFHRKFAEYAQEQWRHTLGIQVDLDVQDWATFYSNLAKGNYQLGGIIFCSEYDDPLAYLETLASHFSFSKWKHAPYQELVYKIKQEKDPQIRGKLAREAEAILYQEMPVIWVVNRSHYYAYRRDLKGLCFDHLGLFDLSFAYFGTPDSK